MIYVYQAFCVTVSTNFDTYIWGLEIEIFDVVGYSKIIFFVLFKFRCMYFYQLAQPEKVDVI